MKKLLVLTLAALTIGGLVGCKANDSKTGVNKNNLQIEQQEDNKENTEKEGQLAKVKSIIGNEISVNLSDKKIDDLSVEDDLNSNSGRELNEQQKADIELEEKMKFEDGSTKGEVTTDEDPAISDEDPAISDEEVQQMIAEGTAVIDKKNKYDFKDISFDLGSKDFTVSAGVKIVNDITGIEGKLSDIKEGTIINIISDKKTNSVIQINILN